MAIKNQIPLSNYSWLDKCNKETFKTWTIPNPIQIRSKATIQMEEKENF